MGMRNPLSSSEAKKIAPPDLTERLDITLIPLSPIMLSLYRNYRTLYEDRRMRERT